LPIRHKSKLHIEHIENNLYQTQPFIRKDLLIHTLIRLISDIAPSGTYHRHLLHKPTLSVPRPFDTTFDK
jgi:hypothetical protein